MIGRSQHERALPGSPVGCALGVSDWSAIPGRVSLGDGATLAVALRAAQGVGVQKSAGTTAHLERHDVRAMLEYLLLLFGLIRAAVRDREAVVAELAR